MIYVDVEPYCQHCYEFEAESENGEVVAYINERPLRRLGDVVVRCKHRKRCDNIKNYLELCFKHAGEVTKQ